MDGEPRSADTAGMFDEKSTHRPGTTKAVRLPAHGQGDFGSRKVVMPALMAAGESGEPPTGGQSELLNSSYATKGGTHKTQEHSGPLTCYCEATDWSSRVSQFGPVLVPIKRPHLLNGHSSTGERIDGATVLCRDRFFPAHHF